jgi:hypothetical protein
MAATDGICVIVPAGQNHFRPQVFGMGILVGEREILTCAHVVNAALGDDWFQQPGDGTVRVCFPFVKRHPCFDGTVDRKRWFPGDNEEMADIAVVQLGSDAPASAGCAILRSHASDMMVKIYGFRGTALPDGQWRSHKEGEWVEGKILEKLPEGRGQFDGLRQTGGTIEKGFSGSGLYNRITDAVVGMAVESDKDKERKIAQFIDVPSLQGVFENVMDSPPPVRSGGMRTAPEPSLSKTKEKKQEIENYLLQIGGMLPPANPDDGLLALVRSIVFDSPAAVSLRAAFGFPASPEKMRPLLEMVAAGEPSTSQFLGIWAHRIDQVLWRYGYTLEYMEQPSAAGFLESSAALRTICAPHLEARQPTLSDIAAVLQFSSDLKAFTESAPDPTLFAVMRAFRHTHGDKIAKAETDSGLALDFLFEYLREVEEGKRTIDDSSNAWWALRIGMCRGQVRFRDLLESVVGKFGDIRVPSEEVSRRSALPEIYRPVRIISYTLSNVQAIMECDRAIPEEMKDRLHEVISTMLDRLLKTPRSNHLYLASVHQEGLRNYLDYLKDQGIAVT